MDQEQLAARNRHKAQNQEEDQEQLAARNRHKAQNQVGDQEQLAARRHRARPGKQLHEEGQGERQKACFEETRANGLSQNGLSRGLRVLGLGFRVLRVYINHDALHPSTPQHISHLKTTNPSL